MFQVMLFTKLMSVHPQKLNKDTYLLLNAGFVMFDLRGFGS